MPMPMPAPIATNTDLYLNLHPRRPSPAYYSSRPAPPTILRPRRRRRSAAPYALHGVALGLAICAELAALRAEAVMLHREWAAFRAETGVYAPYTPVSVYAVPTKPDLACGRDMRTLGCVRIPTRGHAVASATFCGLISRRRARTRGMACKYDPASGASDEPDSKSKSDLDEEDEHAHELQVPRGRARAAAGGAPYASGERAPTWTRGSTPSAGCALERQMRTGGEGRQLSRLRVGASFSFAPRPNRARPTNSVHEIESHLKIVFPASRSVQCMDLRYPHHLTGGVVFGSLIGIIGNAQPWRFRTWEDFKP
ncbi:hypothetical protein C8R47DRAFT_1079511 [Mycena vitilis]|nr:hypothetical protein C8R47DRAFT_1079511 [Mycena vitilis]